ncbi:MAG: thioredoxin [bacterium]
MIRKEPWMQSVSKEQFSEIIGQSQKLVVVDCGAAWCGPCKKLTPILEELGVSMGEKIDVVYVDVGEQPALAREHGVMSLPTVLFFKNGEILDRIIGLVGKDKIIEKINSLA